MLLIMILVYFNMDCINLFIYRLNYMFHSINHESHEQRVLLIQYPKKISAFLYRHLYGIVFASILCNVQKMGAIWEKFALYLVRI